MSTTLSTLNPILKEIYGPRLESQLQSEIVGLKRIEQTAEGLDGGGKYVTFPVRVSRNPGVGTRFENETLPVPGTQGYRSVQIPLKYDYGALRLSGPVLKMAESNPQTFASGMDSEMEGLKEDLVKSGARQFYGDGTGLLATTPTTGAVNVFIANDLQYLNEGDRIDIVTTATAVAKATNRNITQINPVTRAVTFDGAAVTFAAGDAIYRQGVYTSTTQLRDPVGLRRIVAGSGVLQNLDPAGPGNAKWASAVLGNAGTLRALSEGLMMNMVDNIRIAGGKKPTVIFTSLGVRRAYFNLLTQQRRYNDPKMYDGGMVGLAFNMGTEIPLVEDVDCTANTMYMVNEPSMKVVKACDWEFIDEHGDIFQKIPGVDGFVAEMRKYWEIATSQRNAHGVIQDIIEG